MEATKEKLDRKSEFKARQALANLVADRINQKTNKVWIAENDAGYVTFKVFNTDLEAVKSFDLDMPLEEMTQEEVDDGISEYMFFGTTMTHNNMRQMVIFKTKSLANAIVENLATFKGSADFIGEDQEDE